MKKNIIVAVFILCNLIVAAQKQRARDIGIPFDGTPGKFNAITDVKVWRLVTAPSFRELVKT